MDVSLVPLVCIIGSISVGIIIGNIRFCDDINWRKIKRAFGWLLCIMGFAFAITSPMIYEYIRVCTDWFDFGWIYNSEGERWSNPSFGASFSLFAFLSLAASMFGVIYLCATMGDKK